MRCGNLNMDMDMDIVHVVMNVHGYINVYQGFLPYPNAHHPVRLFGSPPPLLLLGKHTHQGCTWKMVVVRHLCGTALVMYCQGMEYHL